MKRRWLDQIGAYQTKHLADTCQVAQDECLQQKHYCEFGKEKQTCLERLFKISIQEKMKMDTIHKINTSKFPRLKTILDYLANTKENDEIKKALIINSPGFSFSEYESSQKSYSAVLLLLLTV